MSKPIVDLHELTHMEVQSHMRPFIVASMMEHEETRHVVKNLERAFHKSNRMNHHDVLQYILIVAVALLFLTS